MTKLRTANLLGALAGAVVERLEARLKSHPNQTGSAAAALNLIALYEGCSNVALSQALRLSHPATVRLVDKLEATGLVENRQGNDRRAVALYLMPAGRERMRAVLEERCLTLDAIIDVLSPDQRQQLDGIAETLLRVFAATPLESVHICRLCDESRCPADLCPVHQQALSLLAKG
ncbi:MarR family winged helix-turn-helix transcriptional regulator [Gloeobacter violaceus]|uniref:MarR family transcriptional regulatory protein n=1 Tax=Gloeobacter violaceus (strain ATCC 29082 / PCC 7421) TaxID=251221 RepID=Q7NH55_GLOVI|nr:MarR family transcriptional regulator [Gloeobacter violaceus]BAC90623.1 MarR family transcriptional regulatory protein [Gloeobacter violaceus PCC 7421]